ncbi:MAG: hypothetical protein KAH95_06305 [Spirochaetales bacterium]|nr:hypothetical protein [Spirochaetales bacterium]
MTRIDFMFAIGYQGIFAIVDKNAKKQYGKLTGKQLAEKGLFKSAFCGALFDEDTDTQEEVISIYSNMSGEIISSINSMKRLLGVFEVPSNISKVTYV